MRTQSLVGPLALILLLALAPPTEALEIVYDNTTNDLGQNLDADGNEI